MKTTTRTRAKARKQQERKQRKQLEQELEQERKQRKQLEEKLARIEELVGKKNEDFNYNIKRNDLDSPSFLANVCKSGAIPSLAINLKKNGISWGMRVQHSQHIPVELVVKEFGEFKDYCSRIEVHGNELENCQDDKFFRSLTEFIHQTNKFHDTEKDRSLLVADKFDAIVNPDSHFTSWIRQGKHPDWKYAGSESSPGPCLLAEVKNEQGTTNSNALIEVMSHYVHACQTPAKWMNPCVLLVL